MIKNYNLEVSVKGCDDLIKRLKYFKNDFIRLKYKYIKNCLKWILEKSIYYLRNDDTFEPSFIDDVEKQTNIIYTQSYNNTMNAYLEYYSDDAIFAEFGTGHEGKIQPHPMARSTQGKSPIYHYESGENSRQGGSWTWKIPEKYQMTGMPEYITFKGYRGKKFIYKAFRDFVNYKIYETEYEKIINALLNKHF